MFLFRQQSILSDLITGVSEHEMELKAEIPDVSKPDVSLSEFCVVCVAGCSCDRPQCSLNPRKHQVGGPLDLSIKTKAGDLSFKKPHIYTPLILKECLRKRPSTLPLPATELRHARTTLILDRDKRSSLPSTATHPYVKPGMPFLPGFGNPFSHILATSYLRPEKQRGAEQ